jgi:hypothetical protein
MTYVLAILAAIAGGGLGFALGAAAAAAMAAVLGMSNFEGASGYFAIFVGGPLGAIPGLVLGPVLVFRRAGYRGLGPLAGRSAVVIASVMGIAVVALAGFWMLRPILNSGGPAPQLEFEIRLPPGAAVTTAGGWSIELQTSRNRMPGSFDAPRQEQGRTVVPGRVELYYRTWKRMVVVTMPDKTDILFDLKLGPSPSHSRTLGPWQRADYIAEPGNREMRRPAATDRYEIRYRVEWAGEE